MALSAGRFEKHVVYMCRRVWIFGGCLGGGRALARSRRYKHVVCNILWRNAPLTPDSHHCAGLSHNVEKVCIPEKCGVQHMPTRTKSPSQ